TGRTRSPAASPQPHRAARPSPSAPGRTPPQTRPPVSHRRPVAPTGRAVTAPAAASACLRHHRVSSKSGLSRGPGGDELNRVVLHPRPMFGWASIWWRTSSPRLRTSGLLWFGLLGLIVLGNLAIGDFVRAGLAAIVLLVTLLACIR